MKRIKEKLELTALKTKAYLSDKAGEVYVDKVVMVLIVVVVGAGILWALNKAMPELFEDMMTKLKTDLIGVDWDGQVGG